jgi:hypothetical protein
MSSGTLRVNWCGDGFALAFQVGPTGPGRYEAVFT